MRRAEPGRLRFLFKDRVADARLVVLSVEDELKWEGSIRHGCAVSGDGALNFFTVSPLGFQSSNGTLSDVESENLNRLLKKLKDDFSRLPPPGRRLVLIVSNKGQRLIRVYDRASPPKEIQGIVRLIQRCIRL
jgi:hypothetical protein